MDADVLRTDVDDFVEFIRQRGKMSLNDVAKELGLDEKTVEAWTDFLVEERILGIEYKFTTPYVFMNSDDSGAQSQIAQGGFFESKEEFFQKAQEKKIPDYKAKILWFKYLELNEDKIKNSFVNKAKSRGISTDKISDLWRRYYRQLKAD